MSAGTCEGQAEVSDAPMAGVRGSCEPPGVGSGNQTQPSATLASGSQPLRQELWNNSSFRGSPKTTGK